MTSFRSARASRTPPTSASVSMREVGVVPNNERIRPPRRWSTIRKSTAPIPMTRIVNWMADSEIRSRVTRTVVPAAPQRSRSASVTAPDGTDVVARRMLCPANGRSVRNVTARRAPFASTTSSATCPAASACATSEYASCGTSRGGWPLRCQAYRPAALTSITSARIDAAQYGRARADERSRFATCVSFVATCPLRRGILRGNFDTDDTPLRETLLPIR